MQNPSITQDFVDFMYNNLRFRCLLKESTVNKFFIENKESMGLLRQAFIHNSFNKTNNYELLEFEGDPILNLATVQYIRKTYPKITSVKWNTRIKHVLVSGKVLAKMAIANGFGPYLVISEELQRHIDSFSDKWDSEDYQAAYEDTMEALCGAIMRILNKHTVQGVGYVACYNLVSSFLKEYPLSLEYEVLFDANSRLKEIFDSKGWDRKPGCTLKNCLMVLEREEGIKMYMKYAKGNFDSRVINTENKFVALGFACLKGDPKDKTLLGFATANNKSNAKQEAAQIVIERLNRFGISLPIPDAYETKPKKTKNFAERSGKNQV